MAVQITSLGPVYGPAETPLTKHLRGYLEVPFAALGDGGHKIGGLLKWRPEMTTYAIARLMIEETAAEPVTSTTIRQIAVNEIITAIMSDAQQEWITTSDGLTVNQLWELQRRAMGASTKRPKPTPRVLELVATIYEIGQVFGRQPLKLVRERFDLPTSTASHWVKLARERGHLDAQA